MALGRTNLDDICEQDLVALIENGVEEDLTIEYKSAIYGRSDKDKIEFLKDVSALANTHGGHIVIGIKDIDGKPVEITPFNVDNIDNEKARLESLLRDRLDPRVNGIRLKVISISEKGHVLVLRVPESWNPPHGIKVDGRTIFYIRNSSGAHPASVEELRVLFTASATAYDRARAFRQDRLSKISSGEIPTTLVNKRGLLAVHVVPISAFSLTSQIDIREAISHDRLFEPLGNTGNARFCFEGLIKTRSPENCHGYTIVFRNGCIESVLRGGLFAPRGDDNFLRNQLEQQVLSSLLNFMSGLKICEVPPPFIVMITLNEVRGAYLRHNINGMFFDDAFPFSQEGYDLPEIMIESYGTDDDYVSALKPAFDALWNAAGRAESPYFDEDRRWIGAPLT